MGGTKIFVLHKKELIRIGAAIVLGLVLIILALTLLLPGRGDNTITPDAYDRFIPGTYVSTIILNDKPVDVRVTVSENEILSIYMSDMAEIQRTFFPLFEPRMVDLAEEVLRYQSAFISPSTDYPVTTGILQSAVQAALSVAEVE